MITLAGVAILLLGHGEDIAVRIFEPRDLARGTLLDAECVVLHVRVFLEDHAAFSMSFISHLRTVDAIGTTSFTCCAMIEVSPVRKTLT